MDLHHLSVSASISVQGISGDVGPHKTRNHHGDLDVILPSGADGEKGNVLWINDGRGNFGRPFYFGAPGENFSGDAGDLDGDGDWDLFLAREGPNEVWLNQNPESAP